MFLSEWREFPSAPCLAGGKKKKRWHFASRCCWNRARPWHASELLSFLVGLRTYQHPGNIPDERRPRLFTAKMETVRNCYVITNQLNVVRISANTNDSQKRITRSYHWQSSLLASPCKSENIWGTDTSPSYNLFYMSQWVYSVPIFTYCIKILNQLKCITKLCLWLMYNDSGHQKES